MTYDLSTFSFALIEKQSTNEVLKCNQTTRQFGLVLTEKQALALVETRSHALKKNGRIEFGGGVIDKIIHSFCDSPYLSMCNYEDTLHELLEIFYYYKNETMDLISDDDLIHYMKKAFNGVCQGSFEILSERELSKLAHCLKSGITIEDLDESGLRDGDEEAENEFY